jgi:polysaccharide biosynthesis/export protein
MKSRFPILAFVLMGLFSLAVSAQTGPASQTVTVVGAVKKTGIYQMQTTGLTLLQALAMSGGLQPTADSRRTKVVRLNLQAVDGEITVTIPVDLRSIISGKQNDLRLQPGDVISIPFSTPRLPAAPP